MFIAPTFLPQVTKIIECIRPDRQTVMFSATFPRQMEALARKILTKPIEVSRLASCHPFVFASILPAEAFFRHSFPDSSWRSQRRVLRRSTECRKLTMLSFWGQEVTSPNLKAPENWITCSCVSYGGIKADRYLVYIL